MEDTSRRESICESRGRRLRTTWIFATPDLILITPIEQRRINCNAETLAGIVVD